MGFRFDETAGLRLLLRSERSQSTKAISLLERYYAKRKREEAA